MNSSTEIPSREEIGSRAADGTLLKAIFVEFRAHRYVADDDPLISALASAHNENIVDLLGLVTTEALQAYRGPAFFRGQGLYCSLIPRIDSSIENMVRVVNALVEAGGSDGAAGAPINAFAKWCAASVNRPGALLELIRNNVSGAERYLAIALEAGAKFDYDSFASHAYKLLEHGSESELVGSIRALGHMSLASENDWSRLLASFRAKIQEGANDAVRASILKAVANRLKDAPSVYIAPLSDIFTMAVLPLGDMTLFEATQILWVDHTLLEDHVEKTILQALASAEALPAGTVHFLDFALIGLLKQGKSKPIRELIEILLLKGSAHFSQFESLMHEVSSQNEILNDWIISWLRKGDSILCEAVDRGLLGGKDQDFSLSIDFNKFSLATEEFLYIARKATGWFFLRPCITSSVIVSLLATAPEALQADLEDLLFDPILINYSGAASGYLTNIKDGVVGDVATRALARLDAYIEGLQSIGNIPELHPSERERQLQWQRRSDLMAESFRKAREKSIFASIVTNSVLLYGNSSINWVKGRADKGRRMEIPLKSISHTIEMPRIDTLDPIGLQSMIATFRNEKPPV